MRRLLLIFSIFLFPECLVVGGETTDSTRTDSVMIFHKISIFSNQNNAKVFLDTGFIGVTPLANFEVSEGNHLIKVISASSLKNWEAEIETFDIYVDRDTTLTSRFRHYYYFSSEPFGAKVLMRDSLLGITPLRFLSYDLLSGQLLFRKKNFQDYIFDLANYNFETGAEVKLKSKGIETTNDLVYKNRGTQFKTKRHIIPIMTLGAASIAGGYLAYNFKNHANEDYDKYLITGNQELLSSSNKNDNYFIVSLVLMQAAIGGLIYFLFFD